MKTHTPRKPTVLSRRNFMHASAAVGSSALMLPRAVNAIGTSLEGYTNWPSVVVGGTLDFFLRDPQAVGAGTTDYPITFTRVGQPDVYMISALVAIGNPGVPADASTNGCSWKRNYRLSVPANWPSGLYYAYIGSGANACTVPFVVRPAVATPGVKTLVCVPMLTVQAYNAYGGKSIYDFNSSSRVRASQVSLDRPLTEAFNSFFDTWSQYLVRWMAKNGLAADFCTDLDIDATPSLLPAYQLYVQAGHDEYWTANRRNTMDAFVANGGNVAYLGGNTCWFQARLAAGNGEANRTLVCYKDAATDPVTDATLKTVPWVALAVPRPENITTGLGFLNGCSWTGAVPPRPDTPTVVMRAEHWAFAGTGLGQGTGFGGSYVGYECDTADFITGTDQRVYPTSVDGTPTTLRILAQADGSNWNALSRAGGGNGEQSGYATVAVFSRGGSAGTVFNAGSSDWAYGLRPELDGQTATPISRITLNVIKKLSGAWTETADVRQFHKVVSGVSGALWNTYYSTGTTAPTGSGMALDGWAFRAFPQPVSGSVPVYRYRSTTPGSTGTRYRYSRVTSLDTTNLSWVMEATAFNAYAIARSDATAVYEHSIYNATTQELSCLYTTESVPPAGWTSGPVVFYVPLDGTTAPVPVPVTGFTLSAASPTQTAAAGVVASYPIVVNQLGTTKVSVNFSAGTLPAGVTAKFSSDSSDGGTTFKLTPSASTPAGTYQVQVNGMSAGVPSASITVTLVVTVAGSFKLSIDSKTLNLPFDGIFGDCTRVTVKAKDGFTGAVTFTVSGVPAGMHSRLSPTTSTSGTQLSVVKPWFGFVTPGKYTLTITGTSGGLSETVTVVADVSLFC